MILAHKYNEDEFYVNDVYADASGLSKKTIYIMETFLLKKLNYRFYVFNYEYRHYLKFIKSSKLKA